MRVADHDGMFLLTDRLSLRPWRDDDREPFAALNADPEVMEFLPGLLTRAESDAMVDRIEQTWADRGLGLFAVEVRDTGDFAGFIGLWPATFEAFFTPAVEVGWRLARSHWGCGYATEGASAALADGFGRLGLDEIVSFTAVINERSQRVMQRLGMTRDPGEDFDHPVLADGHRLRRHVLYRLASTAERPDGG
jgi:RimJ/RimL family protein N-acetyltransferase